MISTQCRWCTFDRSYIYFLDSTSVVFSLVGQRFEVSLQRTYAGSNDFKVPMLVQRDPHTGITSTSNEEVPGGQWQQLVRVSVGDTESTRVLLLERIASSPCHGPFAGHAHFIIPRWRASISGVESFSEDSLTLGWSIHSCSMNRAVKVSRRNLLVLTVQCISLEVQCLHPTRRHSGVSNRRYRRFWGNAAAAAPLFQCVLVLSFFGFWQRLDTREEAGVRKYWK